MMTSPLTPSLKGENLDIIISHKRAELKEIKARNEQLYNSISAGRAHRVLRSSASSTGSVSSMGSSSSPLDKQKMVRVLRMWGNEKTETNIRSIEGELDNEENTSPEVGLRIITTLGLTVFDNIFSKEKLIHLLN